MNDGVKILLERMQTHPEEFHGEYNKWNEVIKRFEKFFTASERALINGALTNIKRDEFTQIVMEGILQEPTPLEIDTESYTIKTAGRYAVTNNSYPTTTLSLQEAVMEEQGQRMRDAIQQELRRLKAIEFAEQTKQQKNKSKMEQLLQRVTGSKY